MVRPRWSISDHRSSILDRWQMIGDRPSTIDRSIIDARCSMLGPGVPSTTRPQLCPYFCPLASGQKYGLTYGPVVDNCAPPGSVPIAVPIAVPVPVRIYSDGDRDGDGDGDAVQGGGFASKPPVEISQKHRPAAQGEGGSSSAPRLASCPRKEYGVRVQCIRTAIWFAAAAAESAAFPSCGWP